MRAVFELDQVRGPDAAWHYVRSLVQAAECGRADFPVVWCTEPAARSDDPGVAVDGQLPPLPLGHRLHHHHAPRTGGRQATLREHRARHGKTRSYPQTGRPCVPGERRQQSDRCLLVVMPRCSSRRRTGATRATSRSSSTPPSAPRWPCSQVSQHDALPCDTTTEWD